MNKQTFEALILKLQYLAERELALSRLGVDLLEYTDHYYFVINLLLESTFDEYQVGWINWFIYERPSLVKNGEANQAWKTLDDGTKVEICHTIDSLWETINENTDK
jgi:hypothetical protein